MQDEDLDFFPKYLDKPKLIGIFDMDEFMLIFLSVVIILTLSLATTINSIVSILGGLGFGFFNLFVYRKIKKKTANGFASHFLYLKGISNPQIVPKHIKMTKPYYKDVKLAPYGFNREIRE